MFNQLFALFISIVMATSISGTTLNVNGCRDSFKRYNVFEFLKSNFPGNFYLLQETHSLPSEESRWELVWRGMGLFSHGSTNSAGVAILFAPKSNVSVLSQCELMPGHLLHAHVKINDYPIHIVNVYAPSNGLERMDCFERLKRHIKNLNDDPLIIGGDFNCTINPELDRNGGRESDMRTSHFLNNILQRFKLSDAWRQRLGMTLTTLGGEGILWCGWIDFTSVSTCATILKL